MVFFPRASTVFTSLWHCALSLSHGQIDHELAKRCLKLKLVFLTISALTTEERHVAVEHPICNSFCRQVVKDCLGDLILAHKDVPSLSNQSFAIDLSSNMTFEQVPKCNDTSQFPKDDTVIPYSENNINGTYMCFKPGIDGKLYLLLSETC